MALTPSQRIRLITDLASRLENVEYSVLDLTLRQFGLPWADQWSGSKISYVISMIEGAPDDVLQALAAHEGLGAEQQGAPPEPAFWRPGLFKVFISHLAAHRAFAADLQKALLKFGITSFVAHNDIEPTLEWQVQIEAALATADALVALLHPDFHQSKWTDQEIGFVMGRGRKVFAVCLGEDPYGFIGRFQGFNGREKDASELAKELFDAYRTNKDTQHRMSEALVTMFEHSDTFAEARRNIGYLEDLPNWEPSFSARVQAALQANGQINGSWGVPTKVTALLTKWSPEPPQPAEPPQAAALNDEIPW